MKGDTLAIVCSGGGMRCAYAAGALVALAQECGIVRPDIVVASSGSASGAVYYVAGQYAALTIIWTKLLSPRRFIFLLRVWKMMDIDYLVDRVFAQQEPLDLDALQKTATRFYIPARNPATKEVRYFSNGDVADILQVLRAAKAIPFFFGRKVLLQGEYYIDGAVGVSFLETIHKAQALGATKIIAIDCRPHAHTQQQFEHLTQTLGGRFVLLQNTHSPAGLVTRNATKLHATFQKGYQDVREHKAALESLVSL